MILQWKRFSAMIVYILRHLKSIHLSTLVMESQTCSWQQLNKFLCQEQKTWILNNQQVKFLYVLKLSEVVMFELKWLLNSKVLSNSVIHIEVANMTVISTCLTMNNMITTLLVTMIFSTLMIMILIMIKVLHFMTPWLKIKSKSNSHSPCMYQLCSKERSFNRLLLSPRLKSRLLADHNLSSWIVSKSVWIDRTCNDWLYILYIWLTLYTLYMTLYTMIC